ncbi:MAG: AraC family transcriptional regulator [Gammaproteobacteria bacterium]|nr:AraC family transcriptional regulator [Gammaproteobacteria bacterium]
MKAISYLARSIMLFVSFFMSGYSALAEQAGLDSEIEALKAEVVELNRELFDLEEQLLYPATTSFAVFVSMDAVKDFEIQSVKLNLDEQDVTSHIYRAEQVEALRRGGIQKVFEGNLKPGLHRLKAEIMGKDRDGRPVKRMVMAEFGKARASKYLEVKISNNPNQNKPDFAIVEWK